MTNHRFHHALLRMLHTVQVIASIHHINKVCMVAGYWTTQWGLRRETVPFGFGAGIWTAQLSRPASAER